MLRLPSPPQDSERTAGNDGQVLLEVLVNTLELAGNGTSKHPISNVTDVNGRLEGEYMITPWTSRMKGKKRMINGQWLSAMIQEERRQDSCCLLPDAGPPL